MQSFFLHLIASIGLMVGPCEDGLPSGLEVCGPEAVPISSEEHDVEGTEILEPVYQAPISQTPGYVDISNGF